MLYLSAAFWFGGAYSARAGLKCIVLIPKGGFAIGKLSQALNNGDKVLVKSRRGSITVNASVNTNIKEGVVFIPFHYADSPANILTNPAFDPKAKIPEFKVCAVKISKAL